MCAFPDLINHVHHLGSGRVPTICTLGPRISRNIIDDSTSMLLCSIFGMQGQRVQSNQLTSRGPWQAFSSARVYVDLLSFPRLQHDLGFLGSQNGITKVDRHISGDLILIPLDANEGEWRYSRVRENPSHWYATRSGASLCLKSFLVWLLFFT